MLIGNEIILSPFAYYRYYANGGDLQPEIDPIKWSGLVGVKLIGSQMTG